MGSWPRARACDLQEKLDLHTFLTPELDYGAHRGGGLVEGRGRDLKPMNTFSMVSFGETLSRRCVSGT